MNSPFVTNNVKTNAPSSNEMNIKEIDIDDHSQFSSEQEEINTSQWQIIL